MLKIYFNHPSFNKSHFNIKAIKTRIKNLFIKNYQRQGIQREKNKLIYNSNVLKG